MDFKLYSIKPLIIFFFWIIIFFSSSAPGYSYTSEVYKSCVQGNDIEKTVERDLPIFNILEVSGAFNINIKSNQTEQFVRISGDENLLPHIATTTSGNKLLIHAIKSVCSEIGITLDISVGNLYALISSGSDDVKVHDLHTDRFSMISEGAGDIELTGWATRFDANISGSGDLESRGLKAHTTTLNISGGSSANIHASKSLAVYIIGTSDVYYSGDPQEVVKDILGAGSLNKIE